MRCCATVVWSPSMTVLRSIRLALPFALLLPLSGLTVAAPVYITDSVSVALFPSPTLKGEPVQRLLSGSSVEVLDSAEGVTQVRTGDGSVGWVRSSFLTANVPAIIQLDEVLALLDELQDELALSRQRADDLQNELVASKTQMASLQKRAEAGKNVGWLKGELQKSREMVAQMREDLASKEAEVLSLQQQLSTDQNRVVELQAVNDDLYAKLAASELIMADTTGDEAGDKDNRGYYAWLWGGVAVLASLGIGFASGYRWLDRKLQKHFGGIRFY